VPSLDPAFMVRTPGTPMNGSLPRAVFLDLDDTILDDSGSVSRCWRETCGVYESEAGGRDASALWGAIDRVRAWYWSDPERHRTGRLNLASARTEIVRMALAELQVEVPGLPSKIAQTYGSLRNRHIQPFADALETVR
jgi:putative hydrolase of the HAD superfamily